VKTTIYGSILYAVFSCVTLRNVIVYCGENLLASRPTSNWRTIPCLPTVTACSLYSQLHSTSGGHLFQWCTVRRLSLTLKIMFSVKKKSCPKAESYTYGGGMGAVCLLLWMHNCIFRELDHANLGPRCWVIKIRDQITGLVCVVIRRWLPKLHVIRIIKGAAVCPINAFLWATVPLLQQSALYAS